MLCKVCSSIDFKRMLSSDHRIKLFSKPTFHHESYTALLKAAQEGCELCTAIDEVHRAEEASADRPVLQDMEAIERGWSWFKRRLKGHPGIISCDLDARKSLIVFRRFYTVKSPPAGTELRDAGQFTVNLRIFAEEDSLGAVYGLPGRPIAIDPISDASLLQIQSWMTDCTSNHRHTCPSDSEHFLPTRVIDVGSGSSDPFLHISNGRKGRWIILSHVWGRQVRYVTEADNLIAMKTAILLDELPATFQDAIFMTRKLGFQYLWIDSLCIVQDQEQDWAAEIVHMHEYYQNASLMIAADSGDGDQCGFLQPRPYAHAPITVPVNIGHGEENSSIFVQRLPPAQREPWPLLTRGWTLQEDVLSPRTVHFQTYQMTWECQTSKFEELHPWEDSSRKRDLLGSSSDSWFRTVSEFANRDLTFKDDTLPALSAIAKEYQSHTHWTYKAGLWLEDMHRCLLWLPARRGRRTRAPSWSWASLDVPRKPTRTPFARDELIMYYEQWHSAFAGTFLGTISEVIDCVVLPRNSDPYGRIQSGSLRMRGPWKEAAEWSGYSPYINPEDDGPQRSFRFAELDPRLKFAPNEHLPEDKSQLICNLDENPADFMDSSKPVLQQLSLFQVLKRRYPEGDIIIALILQSVQEEKGTFRRRGIAQLPIAGGHAESGWETREVRII